MSNIQSHIKQIVEAKPVTQEMLDSLSQWRKENGKDSVPRYYSGRKINVGDLILFVFFEDNEVKINEKGEKLKDLILTSIHPDELGTMYEKTDLINDELIFSVKYKK